jgi:uncharacterized protein (TIGR03437 family)
MPARSDSVEVHGACDGRTWSSDETARGSIVSVWTSGLPDNADRANTVVRLGELRLAVDYVGERDAAGLRQVNAAVPAGIEAGEHGLTVQCGGAASAAWTIRVL